MTYPTCAQPWWVLAVTLSVRETKFRYYRRHNMSIFYDMASGKTQSSPEKSNTTAARDELIPALAVREPSSGGSNEQSKALSIHLISALLNKDWTS
jgi:hypothetical protein